jgi:hypothetical protein
MVAVRHTYDAVIKTSEQNCPCAMRRLGREDNIKLNLRECYARAWTGFIWLWIESMVDFFEYGGEHWCSLLSS